MDTPTLPASPAAIALEPSTIGDVLGRYRLDGVLGEVGMGVVYAAFDPALQRKMLTNPIYRQHKFELELRCVQVGNDPIIVTPPQRRFE